MEAFEYNQLEAVSCALCGRRTLISQKDLEASGEHARNCDRCRESHFLWHDGDHEDSMAGQYH